MYAIKTQNARMVERLRPILGAPVLRWVALLGLSAAYLQGGFDKAAHFSSAIAEMNQFEEATKAACLTPSIEGYRSGPAKLARAMDAAPDERAYALVTTKLGRSVNNVDVVEIGKIANLYENAASQPRLHHHLAVAVAHRGEIVERLNVLLHRKHPVDARLELAGLDHLVHEISPFPAQDRILDIVEQRIGMEGGVGLKHVDEG
jgi:hypothetical protein